MRLRHSTGVTGGYGTPPSCTACPDGTTAQAYIVVNTQMCYSTLFHMARADLLLGFGQQLQRLHLEPGGIERPVGCA